MIINVFGEWLNPDHIVRLMPTIVYKNTEKVIAWGMPTGEGISREIAEWRDTTCEAVADEINKQIKEATK